MRRRLVLTIMVAAAVIVTSAAPGAAETVRNQPSPDVGIQAVVYISGQDVVIGTCKAWMNRRTSDNYVQALGQSWQTSCTFWLERKRIGEYDWTRVSDVYTVWYTSARTGFHWNGTNAGSRVCLYNSDQRTTACSSGYW
jgi:hypothetical protein